MENESDLLLRAMACDMTLQQLSEFSDRFPYAHKALFGHQNKKKDDQLILLLRYLLKKYDKKINSK